MGCGVGGLAIYLWWWLDWLCIMVSCVGDFRVWFVLVWVGAAGWFLDLPLRFGRFGLVFVMFCVMLTCLFGLRLVVVVCVPSCGL